MNILRFRKEKKGALVEPAYGFEARDVLLDIEAADTPTAFAAVAALLQEHHGCDAKQVTAALLAREALGSTGIGLGIAIPHARIDGLAKARAVFVRLRTPISHAAPDNEPVRAIFAVLMPQFTAEVHVRLLAHFAEMAANPVTRGELFQSTEPGRISDLIGSGLGLKKAAGS